jgi:hypothetical protein
MKDVLKKDKSGEEYYDIIGKFVKGCLIKQGFKVHQILGVGNLGTTM